MSCHEDLSQMSFVTIKITADSVAAACRTRVLSAPARLVVDVLPGTLGYNEAAILPHRDISKSACWRRQYAKNAA
tara:strand:+ start:312039 stop:312263 length:225 start_codon:yes stop_codon:yes gene_type:complete